MRETTSNIAERLSALEGQLADQRATLARQQGELVALRRRLARRRGTAVARALATAVVAVLLATPLAALAANFTDLNPGSPHNANINAIADAGISLGCNPAGTQYCPNQLVTREQMASFLARTAGLGTNPPIANAATAVNATNAVTAQTAINAPNAQPKYARIIVVGPVGTAAQNGDALRAALTGITGATADNRFLILLEPGVYDLGGANSLNLKTFVDLVGSGQETTTITHGAATFFSAVSNMALRDLTIVCQPDGNNDCRGVSISGLATPVLSRVTIQATAAGSGTAIGINVLGGSPIIEDSTIVATGGTAATGINHDTSIGAHTLTVRRSVIRAEGGDSPRIGIRINGIATQTVIVEYSRLAGNENTISAIGGGDTVRVLASQLSGGPVFNSGATITCAYVWDETFLSVNGCP